MLLPLSWLSEMWLPRRPLATDNPSEGVYRMSRDQALTKRLIEANPQSLSNLLCVDIDTPDAALRALSAQGSHPMPSLIVENGKNGHAHAVWWLREPVTRTEFGSLKAIKYAESVTEGLRRAVNGDNGYSGLLVKNPAHADWRPHWLHRSPRSLVELDNGLRPYGNMPPARWRRNKGYAAAGLGRNCALFDDVRRWAYREVRKYFGEPDQLAAAVLDYAVLLNAEFSEPLPLSEVRAIAASIHRWIVTKSDLWRDGAVVFEATFSTIQAARVRKRWAGKRTDEMLTTGDPGLWGAEGGLPGTI